MNEKHVFLAVEGLLDEVVGSKILTTLGVGAHTVVGREGKASLLKRLASFNRSAASMTWVVLVDLDHDAECAPPAAQTWLPKPAPRMVFRIAVREIESWLLADRESVAKFLGCPKALVPRDPDAVADPKQAVVNLARKSSQRAIREGLVPRGGSGRNEGPTYTSDVSEYVRRQWRPDVAARNSDSLRRCLHRIAEQIGAGDL